MIRPYWLRIVKQRRCPTGDETIASDVHMGDPDASKLPASGDAPVDGELAPNFDGLDDASLIPDDSQRELPDKPIKTETPKAKKEAAAKKQEAASEQDEPIADDASKAEQAEKEKEDIEKKATAKKAADDAKKAAEGKKPDDKKEQTPEEKKAADKKAADDLKAKEEADKPKTVPKDDKDLDAIQPRPGSNPKVGDDFTKLKTEIKTARQIARELEAEKVKLETQLKTVKPLDEDTQKRLEFLEGYHRIHEGANDPRFKEDWDKKIEAANEGLLGILATKIPAETLQKMKDVGLEKYNNAWWNKNILNNDKLPWDPIEKQKIVNAIIGRDAIKEQREQAVQQLAQDREKFGKEREAAQQKWWQDWGKKIEETTIEVAKGHEWASKIEVADDADAATKKRAEEHNAQIDEKSKEFAELTRKVAALDPKTVSTVIFGHMRANVVEEKLKATEKEAAEFKARAEELENELAEIHKAGKSRPSSPTPKKEKGAGEYTPGKEVSADEAFAAAGL